MVSNPGPCLRLDAKERAEAHDAIAGSLRHAPIATARAAACAAPPV
jgi:hypothetical protein